VNILCNGNAAVEWTGGTTVSRRWRRASAGGGLSLCRQDDMRAFGELLELRGTLDGTALDK